MDFLFNDTETMLFQFLCGSTKTVRASFQLHKITLSSLYNSMIFCLVLNCM